MISSRRWKHIDSSMRQFQSCAALFSNSHPVDIICLFDAVVNTLNLWNSPTSSFVTAQNPFQLRAINACLFFDSACIILISQCLLRYIFTGNCPQYWFCLPRKLIFQTKFVSFFWNSELVGVYFIFKGTLFMFRRIVAWWNIVRFKFVVAVQIVGVVVVNWLCKLRSSSNRWNFVH